MAAADNYASHSNGLSSPPRRLAAITPHDVNELGYVTRGIYVGGDGNIVVVSVEGDEVTLVGAKGGTVIPVRAKQVKTSTTATSLVAMW